MLYKFGDWDAPEELIWNFPKYTGKGLLHVFIIRKFPCRVIFNKTPVVIETQGCPFLCHGGTIIVNILAPAAVRHW
jgi:hypothetical protein